MSIPRVCKEMRLNVQVVMFFRYAVNNVHLKTVKTVQNENSHCRLNEANDETLPFETMAENMKDSKSEGNSIPKC